MRDDPVGHAHAGRRDRIERESDDAGLGRRWNDLSDAFVPADQISRLGEKTHHLLQRLRGDDLRFELHIAAAYVRPGKEQAIPHLDRAVPWMKPVAPGVLCENPKGTGTAMRKQHVITI